MTRMMYDVAAGSIRGNLNLMFSISKCIATVLNLADSMPLARETLRSLSGSLLDMAAEVHGLVCRDLDENLFTESAGAEDRLVEHINDRSDLHEQNIQR